LEWALKNWLTIEASYGYSFRAPDPGNLDQSGNSVIAATLPDPSSSSGQSRVLLLCCNNQGLRQEHAIEKTVGVKARHPLGSAMGIEASLHYFAIRLKDRIEAITYSDQLLTDSQHAYAVTRDPTIAELQAVCSTGRYLNGGQTCPGSDPAAIVDLRLRNVSSLETQGVDFDTALKWELEWGSFAWRTNGTYLLQYSEVAYPGAAAVSRLNTDHNPINLRLKESVDWHLGPISVLVAMNFTNNYRDADSQPNRPIASLTTFDWQLKYVIGKSAAPGAIAVSAGMQNIFNRAVPFLQNRAANVGYDQENFDPLGRVWFAKLALNW
jgi:iron complex outermembrane receptor protein